MKKTKKTPEEGRSLRTLFLYVSIVLTVIFIALCIKSIFILKKSRYDGKNIIIALSQNNKIVGIVGINSVKNSTSFLTLKSGSIPLSSSAEKLGIIPDAIIDVSGISGQADPESLFSKFAWNPKSKTNLTVFDTLQLVTFTKNVQSTQKKQAEIDDISDSARVDKVVSDLFANDTIASENLSIQIINATDIPGLGKKLERVIANNGGNVVAVSSVTKKQTSVITYVGRESYSVEKFKKLLHIPAESIVDKSIADVTIVIGEDYKKTPTF